MNQIIVKIYVYILFVRKEFDDLLFVQVLCEKKKIYINMMDLTLTTYLKN